MKPTILRLGRMRIMPVPSLYWNPVLSEPAGSGVIRVRAPGYRHRALVIPGEHGAVVLGLVPGYPLSEPAMMLRTPDVPSAERVARMWVQLQAWEVVFTN